MMSAKADSMPAPGPASIGPAASKDVAASRRGYVLLLLMLIMGMNQLDRGIVAILLDSIKAEMHLSDTAMGLVVGSGFAIIYALASLPLARIADRHSRKAVIGIGMIFYSLMAIAMGFAQNVYQLVAARAAIAIGEASGSAPSTSLISEYYQTKDRARAMSIWSAGSYLGLFIGLTAGGWINQHYGWRMALWATAAPGLLIAALFLITVREPRRPEGYIAEIQPLGPTLRTLMANRTYMILFAGFISQAFVMYSLTTWAPALLGRIHHMQPAEVGFYAGMSKGVCSLIGAITGGFITHRIAGDNLKRMAIVPIIGALLMPFGMMVFLLADDVNIALAGLFFACFLLPIHYASALAMLHAVVTPEVRSLASAMVFLAMALGGLALGPVIVGFASDIFGQSEGAQGLRHALLIPAVFGFLSALLFYMSRSTVEEDSAKVQAA